MVAGVNRILTFEFPGAGGRLSLRSIISCYVESQIDNVPPHRRTQDRRNVPRNSFALPVWEL